MPKVCPACQAEYIDLVTRCADCGVALVSLEEATVGADEERDERVRGRREETEEVEFDLSEWTNEERGLLDGRLDDAGVIHRWEGAGPPYLPQYGSTVQEQWQIHTSLVVREEDADRVEEILDEVEYPDALEPVTDADADDEASYAVMSDLYVAADRLKNNPADNDAASDLVAASEAAATASVPYGVEIRVWEQVQAVAASVAEAIDTDADEDVIARDAATLRGLLSRYV